MMMAWQTPSGIAHRAAAVPSANSERKCIPASDSFPDCKRLIFRPRGTHGRNTLENGPRAKFGEIRTAVPRFGHRRLTRYALNRHTEPLFGVGSETGRL